MFYNADWSGVNISEFIGILNEYLYWYNEKRIKKSLGYLSPIEYRHRLGLVTYIVQENVRTLHSSHIWSQQSQFSLLLLFLHQNSQKRLRLCRRKVPYIMRKIRNLSCLQNQHLHNSSYSYYRWALVLYFRLSGFPIFPRRKSLQLMK